MTVTLQAHETILVTGGAGFIGTHLCRELTSLGYRVVSLDLKGVSATPVEMVSYVQGDARNSNTLEKLLTQYQITSVYHLAATVSVPLCQNDPIESYSHNVGATLTVLDACRKVNELREKQGNSSLPIRVAFASSAALYGNLGDNQRPLSENRIAERFSSFYAAQKHASEKAIELYLTFYKIPALIFRFFNVYGHGQDPMSPYSGVITVFTRLAKEKKSLLLNNSGIQTRDFIPVSEVVRAIASALKLPPEQWDSSVVNLGTGASTTIRELAELIRDLSGSDSPMINAPPREGDVLHSLADIRRAQALLKFAPLGKLSEKLKELIAA